MARLPLLMNGIIVLLTFFVAMGILLSVKALLAGHAETRARFGDRGKRSIRRRIDDYVGPIDRSKTPLNPPLRVLIEFCMSLGGFPGLGWLLSGRMFTGIILMSMVPGLVWVGVPFVLIKTGLLVLDPYSAVIYLPFLALASAGTLAVLESRAPRTEAHPA